MKTKTLLLSLCTVVLSPLIIGCGGGGGGGGEETGSTTDTTAPVIMVTGIQLSGTTDENATVTITETTNNNAYTDTATPGDTAFNMLPFELDGTVMNTDPGAGGAATPYVFTISSDDALTPANTSTQTVTVTLNSP